MFQLGPSLRFLLLAVVAVAVATGGLAGCGGSDDGETRPATMTDVEGRQFMLVEATGRTVRRGVEPTLEFYGDHRLNASGGCNDAYGPYTLRGGRLRRGDAATTQMGCGGDLEASDRWLGELLQGDGDGVAVTVEDGGQRLVLAPEGQRIVFGQQGPKGGPTPIEGPRWTAIGLIEEEGNTRAVEGPMVRPTLQIDDGEAKFFTGCNEGTASARVVDGAVEFGKLDMTEKTCPGYVGRVERFALQMLGGDATATFSGHTLRLARDNVGLEFSDR